jgi:hypothetical protein
MQTLIILLSILTLITYLGIGFITALLMEKMVSSNKAKFDGGTRLFLVGLWPIGLWMYLIVGK